MKKLLLALTIMSIVGNAFAKDYMGGYFSHGYQPSKKIKENYIFALESTPKNLTTDLDKKAGVDACSTMQQTKSGSCDDYAVFGVKKDVADTKNLVQASLNCGKGSECCKKIEKELKGKKFSKLK